MPRLFWKRTSSKSIALLNLSISLSLKKNTGTCTPHTGLSRSSSGKTDADTLARVAGTATEFAVESATVYSDSSGCRVGTALHLMGSLVSRTKGLSY
ncbi:hypothetical protein M378DRAFT_170140, partial [Amanita muscaria Koide BX008]